MTVFFEALLLWLGDALGQMLGYILLLLPGTAAIAAYHVMRAATRSLRATVAVSLAAPTAVIAFAATAYVYYLGYLWLAAQS